VGHIVEPDRLHGQVFDAVPDPLVVMDARGVVVAANAAALRMLDLDAPVAGHRRARAPRLAVDVSALCELAVRGDRVDGVPVVDRIGRATGVVVDAIPLGARGGTVLFHFRARSESIGRELWTDDAVATVAHEFRSPLTAMHSALNLLSSGDAGALTPGQRRFVDAITRGVGRLARIVDGYLDLGRARAGVLALERRDQNVHELLSDIAGDLALCQPAIGERLAIDVAEDAPSVFADRDRITQVLLNLVYNAARFTPEGRGVTLRAARAGREALDDRLRLLPFEILGEPRFACIEVEDEGIGMSADVLAHVFDRYHEDADDAGQPGGGAHLGLHIARALVDAHDGTLCIESRLGEGTTARVFLPADFASAWLISRLHTAEHAVEVAHAARRPVRVTLVEDASIRVEREIPVEWGNAWAIRDGLALVVSYDREAVVPAAVSGTCRVDGKMTFSGALRAAGKKLLDQKSSRGARAVPGLEPVRE